MGSLLRFALEASYELRSCWVLCIDSTSITPVPSLAPLAILLEKRRKVAALDVGEYGVLNIAVGVLC